MMTRTRYWNPEAESFQWFYRCGTWTILVADRQSWRIHLRAIWLLVRAWVRE